MAARAVTDLLEPTFAALGPLGAAWGIAALAFADLAAAGAAPTGGDGFEPALEGPLAVG